MTIIKFAVTKTHVISMSLKRYPNVLFIKKDKGLFLLLYFLCLNYPFISSKVASGLISFNIHNGSNANENYIYTFHYVRITTTAHPKVKKCKFALSNGCCCYMHPYICLDSVIVIIKT